MDFNLMDEEKREKLKCAYALIENVIKELSIEYDDFIPAETSLYYLKRSIDYEKINS